MNAIDLLRRIAESITEDHDLLSVDLHQYGPHSVVTLKASKSDTPRLVGERGAHIRAFQNLCFAMGQRANQPMFLKLAEPTEGEPSRFAKFVPRTEWDSGPTLDLLRETAEACFVGPVQVEMLDKPLDIVSCILIRISPGEDPVRVKGVVEAIRSLWGAAGKAKGRLVLVEAVQEKKNPADESGVKHSSQ